ncbi:LysR family transcriptional regulator, partial [Pyramidobacter sp.]
MNLRQLKTFCSIVDEGSFRKASEALNISQPSVSQQISALEDDIGASIFKREGRGVALTTSGHALYSLARELLQMADLIPQHFSEMKSLRRGHLAIGATHHMAEILLPGVIGEFKRDFPDVGFTILTGNGNKIIRQVLEGKLEFGIIGKVITRPYEDELEHRNLGFERLCLTLPKGHPWEGREISVDELAKSKLPLARYTRNHPLGFLVDNYLLQHKISLRDDLVFNSVILAARFVAEGACIALVSEYVALRSS